MDLAKPFADIGLNSNTLEPMLAFWRDGAGLAFDHKLPVFRGMDQYRFDAGGSVVKVNHHAAALPERPPGGYREIVIARAGLTTLRTLADPDGNRVVLAPPGTDGVDQIGVRLLVRDLERHRRFYSEALELPERETGVFLAGRTLIFLEESSAAAEDAAFDGRGWRYLTLQVFKVDAAHAHVLAHGGREAGAPRTLGKTARISMVRDPDGNWIELSQRASLTGSLE